MSTKTIIGISCGAVALIVAIVLFVTVIIPRISPTKHPDEPNQIDEKIVSEILTNIKTAADYDSIYKIVDDLSNGGSAIIRAFGSEQVDMESATTDAAPGNMARDTGSDSAAKSAEPISPMPASDPEFSDTNIQVEGVDEADVIKSDGEYIYAINTEALYIIKANNGKPELMSKVDNISKQGQFYSEMYLNNNRVIAIKNNVYGMQPYNAVQSEEITFVDVFDISDKEKPVLVETLSQSGSYKHSRMIKNHLYLITDYTILGGAAEKDKVTTFVPTYAIGEKEETFSPEDITVMPDPTIANYTIISGIDTDGTVGFVDQKSILGESYELYANDENLYLSSVKYEEERTADIKIKTVRYFEETLLTKVSIKNGDINIKTSATIPGRILNQFSLDEYKGVLRVVTTVVDNTYYSYASGPGSVIDDLVLGIASSSTSTEHNSVMTLDENLNVIGSIGDIAPNEQVYSCRFMGDVAYFVTFRQVDPLFTVDLSDPTDPTIIGELKIPGFSDYLHPYAEGLLFGLGRDADNFGRTDSLKLSMFDNSDPTNVTEKDKLILDGYYFSEASYNHKAILVDQRKNLVAFPADGKYLIYTYDKTSGFKQEAEIQLSEEGFMTNEFIRGMFIDNIFYVITSNSVNAYDMDSKFAKLGTLELPKKPQEVQPMPLPTPRNGIIDIIE